MSKIAEERVKLATLVAAAKATEELATKEARELNAEEFKTLAQQMADIEATEETIKQLEQSGALRAKLNQKIANLDRLAPSRTQNPDQNLSKDYTLEVKPAWEGRSDFGYKNGFEFCGELLNASLGFDYSERLHACCANSDVPSTLNDPAGGVLVPPAFIPNEMRVGYDDITSIINTSKIPMASPKIELPALIDKDHRKSVSGGFIVTRKAEGHKAIVESMASYETVTLDAKDLFGFCAPTRNLLSDSVISFAAIINRGMREEFPSKLMEERMRGTGVGEYLGVLNSDAKIEVKKGASQAAESIIFQNIASMRSRIWRYSGSIWMANQDTISDLILMNHPTNASMPIWIPSGREDIPDVLFGRPLVFTEHASSIGEVGDLCLINWSQYLEGSLQGMNQETSLHARFFEHDAVFKFWMRNDGCPWWKTTMQPKHGKNTLSPIITIEKRAA